MAFLMIPKRFCFQLSLLLCISSCGYRLQGSGSILPNDIKTISIKTTKNNTTVPGLGPRFTEKLRSRFERAGIVKILDSGESADAELVTEITQISSRNREVAGKQNVQVEQDLTLNVSVELKKRNGQILYRNLALTASESFGSVGSNVVTTSSSFAQGNLSASSLNSLNQTSQREVARGQSAETLEGLMDEAARKIYLESVSSDF
jgi:outer membrane lipopolysaccharide assembly protein LptE/RlpB